MYITLNEILLSFGTNKLGQQCLDFYESHDWSYETIVGEDRDEVVLGLLKNIEADTQVVGCEARTKVWDDGWKENLDMFLTDRKLESIYPKFIRSNQPVRFNRELIRPNDPNFERNYATLFAMWVASEFLAPFEHIYEFGCGSGFNIIAFAEVCPNKHIIGTDFSPSAVRLIKEISKTYNLNVESGLFNMIEPDYSFVVQPKSAVFTSGAIEQLAGKFNRIIDYWIDQKVDLLVHMEPIVEFLDPNNFLDYLVIKFVQKRGYSQGFLSYLRKLQEEGKIEIIKEKRLFFGSLRIEGRDFIVWRPKK